MADSGKSRRDQGGFETLSGAMQLLGRNTTQLNQLSIAVILLTFSNLVLLVFVLVGRPLGFPLQTRFNLFIISILVAFGALLAIILFDVVRRKGEAMFEELSNYHQSTAGTEPQVPESLEFRLLLRQFLSTTTLPLVRGRAGPAYYALLNIVMMLLSATFFSLATSGSSY